MRLAKAETSYLFWAFSLPLCVMWLIYIALEVFPFGTNSVLVLDLNGQYVYFFEELRQKILEGGSMLYSWSRTLGGEFMGIYAYYLSSPFSYIVALFPKENITEALLTIILLKTGCMGLTMGIYLNSTTRFVNKKTVVMFSAMYALSAYAVVQAHNTMWIDNLIALPLIALGIEQLITKRKFVLFVCAFSYSLLTSYYIGYMTCFFVAAYFFYYYFAHSDNAENNFYLESWHFPKSLGRIILYSATSLCIASAILLPAYYSLTFGKTTFSDPKFTFTQKFDFLDMIAKLLPGSYDTVRPTGLPFLYCGTVILLLVPAYFFVKTITAKEKAMSALLISFFVLSFNTAAIDMVWHGFQKPNWLNYRYSFMLIFILIVLAYKAFTKLETVDFKNVLLIALGVGVLILIIQKQNYEFLDDITCIWFSIALIGVFTLLLYIKDRTSLTSTVSSIICIVMVLELFLAGLMNTVDLDDDVVISRRTTYVNYMEKMQPAVDFVKEYDTAAFYRMEKTVHRKTNDPMTLDFNGISNSTSTLNASVIRLLHQFGYSSKSNWTKYLGGNVVADSLLGIKYVITDSAESSVRYQSEKIHTMDETDYVIWQNPYAMSIAYGVNSSIFAMDFEEQDSPFILINDLVTAMLGSEEPVEIFKKIRVVDTTLDNIKTGFVTEHKKYDKRDSSQSAEITYTVLVPSGVEAFIYLPTDYPREATLFINGIESGTIMGNETDRMISLGYYEEETNVDITITLKNDPLYIMTDYTYFYYLDEEVYNEVMPKIGESQLEVTEFEDTYIMGTVNVAPGDTALFTTIPYDEGWVIKVDGEITPIVKAANSLIAVNMEEGIHTVEFEYKPKTSYYGSIITCIGIGLFIIEIAVYVITRKKQKKDWKNDYLSNYSVNFDLI